MTATEQKLKMFAEATAYLRNALPGYEERPQQVALAEAIERVMSADWDDESGELPPALAGQAGCGTGKSFALSIPAALCGGRVVIATGTIALQRQIIDKDLPFLAEHLPDFPKYALLMGRGNYLCAAKLAEPGLDLPQLTVLQQAMADEDNEGTRDSIDVEINPEQWRQVSSTGTECPGAKQCPFSDKCKAETAKKTAAEAKIVVTNYAMLGLDMVLREKAESTAGPMLGDYRALFCDEADSADHALRNALAAKLTQRGLMMLATGAESFVKAHGQMDGDQLKEAVAVTQALWGLAAVLPKKTDEDKPNADPEGGKLRLAWFGEHAEQVMALVNALKSLSAELKRVSEDGFGPKEKNRKRMLVNQAENAMEALQDAVLAEDGEMARFATWNRAKSASGRGGEDFFTVEFHPVLIADRLRENLWSRQATVAVSATLTTSPGDFGYFTRTLGLEHAQTIDVGTPFDYATQAIMFIPDPSVPAPPQRDAWMAYSIMKSHELVKYSGGGALLLYTSRKAMMEAHAVLAPRFEKMGLTVLVQDGNTPNGELAARFRDDVNSVLFGLKSFFVGLDVQGESLRLVIIDKLPFPVPTEPIIEARSEAEQAAGRNPFSSLLLPIMTLDLTQAFGRGVRSKRDRVVVAVLDSRLSSKAYGKKIIDGLPDCPVEVEEDKVEAFFAAMAN